MKRMFLFVTVGSILTLQTLAFAKTTTKKELPQIDRETYLRLNEKSQGAGIVLSLLLGFGAGNYYAESYPAAVGATMATIASIGLIADGASKFNNGEEGFGIVLLLATKIFDVAHAAYAVKNYNIKLHEQSFEPYAAYDGRLASAGFRMKF